VDLIYFIGQQNYQDLKKKIDYILHKVLKRHRFGTLVGSIMAKIKLSPIIDRLLFWKLNLF